MVNVITTAMVSIAISNQSNIVLNIAWAIRLVMGILTILGVTEK